MTEEESVPATPPQAADGAELEARLAEAEARAQDNWDKLLRANAELDKDRKSVV